MLHQDYSTFLVHPEGESAVALPATKTATILDTPGGSVRVVWDSEAPLTPLGQFAYFAQFLKVANLFEPWVADCPLVYTSGNAPSKTDVLGTALLSAVAGQRRYAHATAIRADNVSPQLLGMEQVVSEDSLRRAFIGIDAEECAAWQSKHLQASYEALLHEPWVMDLDTTVKCLYGKQEGAEIGYNPRKPGRPSHVLHTYLIAATRLVLDVDILPGNEACSKHSLPGFKRILANLPKSAWPTLVRGDTGYGNDAMMRCCEEDELEYLFKLKLTRNARELIRLVTAKGENWEDAGQGWEGVSSSLQLQGWDKARRVVILRRKLKEPAKKNRRKLKKDKGPFLPFIGVVPDAEQYEYAILVTNRAGSILEIAQLYRDRGDAENCFDELKNQWGWGGFSTRDLHRTQITARIVAQVYNWWNVFARLAIPDKHAEGITSRPLLLHSIGRQTTHAGQTTIHLTSTHGKAERIQLVLTTVAAFLKLVKENAEQLAKTGVWHAILSRAFQWFLRGRPLALPTWLTAGKMPPPPCPNTEPPAGGHEWSPALTG